MFKVNGEGQYISFREQERRFIMPVERAGTDLSLIWKFVDGGVNGRKNSVGQDPHDGRGGEQGEDALDDQQAFQRRAGKRRHAARRDRLPGKSWFGEGAHRLENLFLLRRLVWHRREHDRHGITQFHHVVHQNFDIISPGGFKFHLPKEHYVAGAHGGIAQLKFHFATAQDRGLVGRDEADVFIELAKAVRPAVVDADAAGDDGQLRHADEVDDTDEEEVAVGFLTDFFAHERALQGGQNSGGLHLVDG